MIPCRCEVLNTLSGVAATDYVKQHLDVIKQDQMGRRSVRCEHTGATFVLEPEQGVYGGEGQFRLRRTDR